MINYLAMCGSVMAGALIFKVEEKLRIERGVLLLVYLVGFLFGCLIGS